MKILSVVGARPNFMKVAPIISAINKHNQKISAGTTGHSSTIHHILVHTGQHYDKMMSDAFFTDLDLPQPDIFLGVGSGSHAQQTAEIMRKFEGVLLQEKPDLIIVVGDVNSTIACAFVASKISYDSNGGRPLIAHVEAGLRSFDRTMPEEINRILTDHVADMLFITEESGITNLKKEGVSEDKIYFVGNTMIDTLMAFKEKASKSIILEKLGLIRMCNDKEGDCNGINPYALLTLHRPSNVDNKNNLSNILQALKVLSKQLTIIFPAHPRTQKMIKEFGFDEYFDNDASKTRDVQSTETQLNSKIVLTDPLGYVDFIWLIRNAKIVLTDSGGVQEETTCLGIPCITLRENTERPVTIEQGTNILAGSHKEEILKAIGYQLEKRNNHRIPQYWDGRAGERIIDNIVKAGAKNGR